MAPVRRLTITLAIDNEEPKIAQFDLLPDEDPVLVAQRLVRVLLSIREDEQRKGTGGEG